MPREKIHPGTYGRQEAHRLKRRVQQQDLAALREALTAAFERGRCHPFMDHLPEEPELWVPELTRRVNGRKLIACRREDEEA